MSEYVWICMDMYGYLGLTLFNQKRYRWWGRLVCIMLVTFRWFVDASVKFKTYEKWSATKKCWAMIQIVCQISCTICHNLSSCVFCFIHTNDERIWMEFLMLVPLAPRTATSVVAKKTICFGVSVCQVALEVGVRIIPMCSIEMLASCG